MGLCNCTNIISVNETIQDGKKAQIKISVFAEQEDNNTQTKPIQTSPQNKKVINNTMISPSVTIRKDFKKLHIHFNTITSKKNYTIDAHAQSDINLSDPGNSQNSIKSLNFKRKPILDKLTRKRTHQ
jgi:hypothetical protein